MVTTQEKPVVKQLTIRYSGEDIALLEEIEENAADDNRDRANFAKNVLDVDSQCRRMNLDPVMILKQAMQDEERANPQANYDDE